MHQKLYGPYAAHIVQELDAASTTRETGLIHVLLRVAAASTEDVNETIKNAQIAHETGVWSKLPAATRSKVLSKLARILEFRIQEITEIETRQTGRALREMKAQLGRLPDWLDYYAALLRTNQAYVAPTQGKLINYVQRVPLGVVAQITPFNHPLLIAVKKIAPALAAGNCVIVKPSELAPISVLEFAKMAESAGVPPGVLSVLPGFGPTTGKALVSHPLIRKVDITVRTEMWLAPIVVFNDADLDSAVNGAAFACFVASGQTCVSGTRLIVQDGIYQTFMARFLEKVESIRTRMGDPLNPKSTMGTVISLKQLEKIEAMMSRSKGAVLTGGKRLEGKSELDGYDFSKGAFFPPTVVADVGVEDELWQEEVFGPVVVVKNFQTEDEGVRLANNCKYGLGAGIWTQDLSRAHRVSAEMEAGLTWVNTHHRNDPSSPWGGMKESGIGRENGLEAFAAYTQSKSTIVNIASAEETREVDDWFAETSEGKRYG
ncbi:aldehyde dehydrogenase [Schizophyllum commune Loenen D]|nr:aldehyde dehydrogenase [Schizophyllum commune Loenen D]